MTEYEEDQIEFSVLSVVRDPLADYTEQLAQNVKGLQCIRLRLGASQLDDDLKKMLGDQELEDLLLGAYPGLGLTEERVDLAETSSYENCSADELTHEYIRMVNRQKALRMSILDEMQSRRVDDAFAEGRRHDYSSALEFWGRALARKSLIMELLS